MDYKVINITITDYPTDIKRVSPKALTYLQNNGIVDSVGKCFTCFERLQVHIDNMQNSYALYIPTVLKEYYGL